MKNPTLVVKCVDTTNQKEELLCDYTKHPDGSITMCKNMLSANVAAIVMSIFLIISLGVNGYLVYAACFKGNN